MSHCMILEKNELEFIYKFTQNINSIMCNPTSFLLMNNCYMVFVFVCTQVI